MMRHKTTHTHTKTEKLSRTVIDFAPSTQDIMRTNRRRRGCCFFCGDRGGWHDHDGERIRIVVVVVHGMMIHGGGGSSRCGSTGR